MPGHRRARKSKTLRKAWPAISDVTRQPQERSYYPTEVILQKRNEKPEVRKAQREEAIRFLLSFNEVFQSELLILQSCKGKSNGKEKIQNSASTEGMCQVTPPYFDLCLFAVGSKSTDEAKSQIPEDC